MDGDDVGAEDVDQYIIYGAYGQVMHRFQIYEMVLWAFQTRAIKPGTTMDQTMERVDRWNSTTLGNLWRGMRTQDHWPPDVVADGDHALEARNFLAHHFLREYFLVEPSIDHRGHALRELALIATRLDDLIATMEAHATNNLGIPTVDNLDEDTRREVDALRPRSWLDNDKEDAQ